jgi:branched-chain amino acid transport system substrate-binding protein
MKILYLFFIFCFLFFSGCSSLANEVDGNVLKIGLITPISVNVDYGPRIRDMINYSVNEINSNGGINGKKIKLFIYDDLCSEAGGASAAKKLIFEDKVKIIFGSACSGATLGAAPIAEENNVIMISTLAQSSDVSIMGDYIFRLTPSSEMIMSRLAEVAYNLGYRKLASITRLTSYTASERKHFIQTFKKLGGEIVLIDSYLPGDEDISQQFLKLKNSDFDSVLILSQNTLGYERMLEQMKKFGISNNDSQFFTNFIMPLKNEDSNYYSFFNGSIYEDYFIAEDSKNYENLINIIDNNFGDDFYTAIPFWGLAISYDIPYMLKEVMIGCSIDDIICIRDNLYSIRNFDGIFNLKKIDENGDGVTESKTFVVGYRDIAFINFGVIGPLTDNSSRYGLPTLNMYNLVTEEINLDAYFNLYRFDSYSDISLGQKIVIIYGDGLVRFEG